MSRVLPILFNTDMVRAILDGRKTVTRRAVRYKYSNTEMEMRTDKYGTRLVEIQKDMEGETFGKNPDGSTWRKLRGYIEPKPPCQPGDILYVREAFCPNYFDEGLAGYRGDGLRGNRTAYKADYHKETIGDVVPEPKWHPSIHMPKEAARIWLKVADVRVERLQEITPQQILKEGANTDAIRHYIKQMPEETDEWIEAAHKVEFQQLWNSTIKKPDLAICGWDANPWVWVIDFERCEKPVN